MPTKNKKRKITKPRNPAARALATRRGGAHDKTRKALRRAERMMLIRDLRDFE